MLNEVRGLPGVYPGHAAAGDQMPGELPSGEVLIAYAGGGTLRVLRRCEECWQQAVAVGGVSGVGRGCRLGSARVRRRPQSHRGKLTAAIDQRV